MHMHSHTNELCTFPPPGLLHYSVVQYTAPYCSEIFAWKLNPQSRLIVATLEWRLVDSQKTWSRATPVKAKPSRLQQVNVNVVKQSIDH